MDYRKIMVRGVEMCLHPKDNTPEKDFGKHTNIMDMAAPFLPKGGTLIDCGANIGSISLHLSPIFDEVIAVEMNPMHQEILAVNLASIPRKRIIHAAIHEASGRMFGMRLGMYPPGNSAVDGNGKGDIPSLAIDDIETDFPITCIKMDVEGAEKQALIGGKRTFKQHKPLLIMETKKWKNWETEALALLPKGYSVVARGEKDAVLQYGHPSTP